MRVIAMAPGLERKILARRSSDRSKGFFRQVPAGDVARSAAQADEATDSVIERPDRVFNPDGFPVFVAVLQDVGPGGERFARLQRSQCRLQLHHTRGVEARRHAFVPRHAQLFFGRKASQLHNGGAEIGGIALQVDGPDDVDGVFG